PPGWVPRGDGRRGALGSERGRARRGVHTHPPLAGSAPSAVTAAVAVTAGVVTVGTMGIDTSHLGTHPARMWCRIPTGTGAELVTNAAEDLPEGVQFVAVERPSGTRVGWWATAPLTGDRAAVVEMLVGLRDALGAELGRDDDFGDEYVVPV